MKRVGPAAAVVGECAAEVVRVARGEQCLPGAKLVDAVSELTLVAIRTAATSYPRAAELSLQRDRGGRQNGFGVAGGWGTGIRWLAQSGGLEYIQAVWSNAVPGYRRGPGEPKAHCMLRERTVRRQGQAPCIWPDLWRGGRPHRSCGYHPEPSVQWDRRLL